MALRMQNPQEAERLALEVFNSDRNDIAAAGILGRALLIQNRAADALIPLQQAARRAADPEVETLLGLALAATGYGEEALDQLSGKPMLRSCAVHGLAGAPCPDP